MAANKLSNDEMREILSEIARESNNAAARIAAIKELRSLDDGRPSPNGSELEDEGASVTALSDLRPQKRRASG